ncbi:MAG: peptidylprolyl isomerase, partial [Gammaproteobacteria bacterium]|nr:peptidylprolyl isomerase [Gammaproteobacteria bacterium]
SYLVEPGPGELETYLAANKKNYRQSSRLAIEQIYLGEKPDPEKAGQLLTALNSDEDTDQSTLGERTFLPGRLGLSTSEAVDGIFGKGFFEQLSKLPPARWSGPVTSSFGVHLVRIIDRSPGRAPALSEIRDVVRRDWSEAKARDVRENDYVQRRSRFIIEIERDDDSAPMKTP